ncbi:MAG: hypothetical protein IKD80_08030 [Selenomonadaceae bacterium]|nr:hypothetical protein [Selenomonadaceae bacterium]
MATLTAYGYKGAQYYYWATYSDGSMELSNGSWNYVRKIYNDGDGDYWDYPKTKVYRDENNPNSWE